jgi:hypothetical protein
MAHDHLRRRADLKLAAGGMLAAQPYVADFLGR